MLWSMKERDGRVTMPGLGRHMGKAGTVVAVIIARASVNPGKPETDLESPIPLPGVILPPLPIREKQGFYLIKKVAGLFTAPFLSSCPLHSLVVTRDKACFLVREAGILIFRERTLTSYFH